MYDRNMFRSYSDKNYVSTTTVNHTGTTVAFAMDDQRKIYYSVLNLDTADRGPIDAVYWNATPGLLPFPDEIIDIAPQATTTMTLPVVKRGSRTESQPDLLAPDEVDPFLSTTARFTAAVPFPVVSDGRYLLVFRQSISATDGDRVYQRAGGLLSADLSHTDFTQVNGANVAAVDGSLLVDRFVLAGSQLRPVVEPRYQRSRSKFAPASAGDTIGTRDMQGRLFYEPTLKLSFVSKLSRGAFSATLLPTAASGVSRWQIFAANDATGRIESFNLPIGTDGPFSVTGQQLYTSPDPRYVSSVLEREQVTDPHTGLQLVPVPAQTDRASTALARLRRHQDQRGPQPPHPGPGQATR